MATTQVRAAQLKDNDITDADIAAANKDGVAGTASMRTLGTGAQQACGGADSRLSDARTPTSHAIESHTVSDITTLNSSTSAHGLLPKLSNVATEYLNGVGGWSTATASIPASLQVLINNNFG